MSQLQPERGADLGVEGLTGAGVDLPPRGHHCAAGDAGSAVRIWERFMPLHFFSGRHLPGVLAPGLDVVGGLRHRAGGGLGLRQEPGSRQRSGGRQQRWSRQAEGLLWPGRWLTRSGRATWPSHRPPWSTRHESPGRPRWASARRRVWVLLICSSASVNWGDALPAPV